MQPKEEISSCNISTKKSVLEICYLKDAINNVKPSTDVNRMMGVDEGNKGSNGGANGTKGGYVYNKNRGNNGDRNNVNLQNKLQFPCLAYGSASYCINF